MNKWNDYHQPPTTDLEHNPRIVVKSGAADMPEKKWKRIFLHSCFSGPYYYRVFNHGTLFFSYETVGGVDANGNALVDAAREFVKAVVEGKNNEDIRARINAVQRVYDYYQF